MLVKVLVELHFTLMHYTLLRIKIARSQVGMMFTPQSFILSGFEKALSAIVSPRKGKFLLKILWDQTATADSGGYKMHTYY